jgi:GNAT superfamily N-acetyltransferase
MAEPQVLTIETELQPADIAVLEDRLYEFNAAGTGIADGKLFGVFLRAAGGAVIGGAYGWSWGGTCHLRYLFVPAEKRGQGLGTRLMQAVEAEARARGCGRMLLETHDFQAPEFYRRLGFAVTGVVEGYPRGHSLLTMTKLLSTA